MVLKVKLLLQLQSITHGTFLSEALMCYVADIAGSKSNTEAYLMCQVWENLEKMMAEGKLFLPVE